MDAAWTESLWWWLQSKPTSPPPSFPPTARKNKKLIKMKMQRPASTPEPLNLPVPVIPRSMSQLVPTMLSVLKAIEPEIIYSGYDGTLPDSSSRLMTTLNRLGGQQVISAVKWAKSLPGKAPASSLPAVNRAVPGAFWDL